MIFPTIYVKTWKLNYIKVTFKKKKILRSILHIKRSFSQVKSKDVLRCLFELYVKLATVLSESVARPAGRKIYEPRWDSNSWSCFFALPLTYQSLLDEQIHLPHGRARSQFPFHPPLAVTSYPTVLACFRGFALLYFVIWISQTLLYSRLFKLNSWSYQWYVG